MSHRGTRVYTRQRSSVNRHPMSLAVTIVGHPFAPIGMGEHLRAAARACIAAGIDVKLRDVYAYNKPEVIDTAGDLAPLLTSKLESDLSIFVLNGDEREKAFAKLGPELQHAGRKIVYPAWELSKYPTVWVKELAHYDELWTTSRHSEEAFKAVGKPLFRMPLPVEPAQGAYHSRRHFGISDSAFVFLFSFDFTSFMERKNPRAVLEAFQATVRARPHADTTLVIKVNNAAHAPAQFEELQRNLKPLGKRVHLLEGTMTDSEIKGLIGCANAFVSLHRAEGFGFGMIEAMYLGKAVIATSYSGNMEYMTPETACLVDHRLVPVERGQYPYGEGQVWADPDVGQATSHMIRLLDDPAFVASLGTRASEHVRTHFSRRAIGLRYRARIDAIQRS